jgi:hypothetical protein
MYNSQIKEASVADTYRRKTYLDCPEEQIIADTIFDADEMAFDDTSQKEKPSKAYNKLSREEEIDDNEIRA